uniref:ACT domain-containing protein n=1 Tax=Chlamydomonas leiostraca TaxID=1034604 RepID=A0A7S0WZM9_9CHLO|mmetsp:Transcript_37942/g.95960  ORF Transcript_37942/g.95960 Transcript_37942/m.95960 type:complete len:277 (+) Transcript_37942:130-960(+)|eukprot:CAMPEP_0202865294 /NCGR_PEP_ID=MMETSP1391-20130828/5589_1 /ASSEMBLY_ACC=CAM_ASM_000867 /TAXON_ID=1034604 /ORGANISM="Chlamydomonas leiostraca, Strain SAG 11-49" /LENGTH=276 /DNA_ID=CAMNT_0049545117 /DNA_START=45 /DNA_END=875 /DNA_ORIENTATION=-
MMLTSKLTASPALAKANVRPTPSTIALARMGPAASCSNRIVDFAPSCPLTRPRGQRIVARSAAQVGSPQLEVKIDNLSDPFATVVSVQYGDRTGELLETITALKNLNLNIRRAKLAGKAGSSSTFFITEADTSEKIVKSARLEEIRMTVLNSLIETFPESAGFATKAADSEYKPLGARRSVVQTRIDVSETPNGAASLLQIVTTDRPGLLVDIVRVLKDINLNVVSAEVDTIGDQARDEFFITYHGEPLTPPMVTLVTNSLQYYLSLNEVAKEASF